MKWWDSVERARAPASLLERVEIWEALARRINASMRDWNEPDALAHECADPNEKKGGRLDFR